jgi:opacity protein-like surface antigen
MAGIEYSLTENISGILGINWKQGFVDVTEDNGVDSKITTGTFGLHAGVLF